MTIRIPWLPEHQQSVLELYLKTDGNSADLKDPTVLGLATIQQRSADSVGYKLGNYRFLDPVAENKKLKGLDGISKADVWAWKKHSGRKLSNRSIKKIIQKGWNDEFGISNSEEVDKSNSQPHLTAIPVVQTVELKSEFIAEITRRLRCRESKAFGLSLIAKPFAILTGASGTGKTKLAESLATHLGNSQKNNSAVIAVGADWTDNRNVLGFVNHLRLDKDSGRPTYQSTPVLDLLLRASEASNSQTPYFLILDEMNLSHVERYFSDFLSVMEQKEGHFDLHSEGPADDTDFTLPVSGDNTTRVPQKLAYPSNLFVIGTVNIDETTYMFSPKVLDRANVIEFKVEGSQFEKFLKNPSGYPEVEVAQPGVAEGFLDLARKARQDGGIDPLYGDTATSITGHLMDLFNMMQAARFEFAYRTGHEISRYLRASQHLAANKADWQSDDATKTDCWKKDLDTQILQKILPKLHGSIGRIAPLITALSHYCETGETDKAQSLRDLLKEPFGDEEEAKALFPRSASKLREMAKTLSVEQFVSFIS
jgi:hypothetical protein